jgi:hypothetical protein
LLRGLYDAITPRDKSSFSYEKITFFLIFVKVKVFPLYHQMLGAVVIHPDQKEVFLLCPEPISKPDGSTKPDQRGDPYP